MKNEELLTEILGELKNINRHFEELINFVQTNVKPKQQRALKIKLAPLTEEDIKNYQNKFNFLYKRWLDGYESEVRTDLEKFSPDEIRRFGDANNLNVTSKTSKEKVLHLISIRFREKKMLSQNVTVTKSLKEQMENSTITEKEDTEA